VNVFLVVPGPVDTPLLAEAALLPSLAPVLRFTPQGTAYEMARRIVRGIERGTRQIIYPRGLAFTFMFPGFARWMQRTVMRANPGDEKLLIRGGSAGGPQVQTVRDT
jgi:short-subunit dehydrogenase